MRHDGADELAIVLADLEECLEIRKLGVWEGGHRIADSAVVAVVEAHEEPFSASSGIIIVLAVLFLVLLVALAGTVVVEREENVLHVQIGRCVGRGKAGQLTPIGRSDVDMALIVNGSHHHKSFTKRDKPKLQPPKNGSSAVPKTKTRDKNR